MLLACLRCKVLTGTHKSPRFIMVLMSAHAQDSTIQFARRPEVTASFVFDSVHSVGHVVKPNGSPLVLELPTIAANSPHVSGVADQRDSRRPGRHSDDVV